MIWFIFAIILLIAAVVLFALHRVGGTTTNTRGVTIEQTPVNLRPWATIPAVIAVIILILSSIATVGARSVGIPVTLGSIGSDMQPGVHLKPPWTNVTSCSLAEQQSIQNADPKTGDALYDQSVPISGSDQGAAEASVTFYYHINKESAGLLYRAYACNPGLIKDNLVAQQVRQAVAQASTAYPSVDLRSYRTQIGAAALKALTPELSKYGVVADSVTISDLTLADNVQTAANSKLAAQQAAQQAQFTLQQAQVEAQTAKVRADAAQVANNAQSVSLTPAVLCQQWIQAIATAKSSVISSGGPCEAAAPAGATTPVIVNPKS